MPKIILVLLTCLFLSVRGIFAVDFPTNLVNGGFEDGLKGWQVKGDVKLETAKPMEGRASLRIGPVAGSVSQRVRTGNGDHLWVSVAVKSEPTNTANLIIRYLDKNGGELMRLDSATDVKPGDKVKPGTISFYMKEHPLTADVEVIISKDTTGGYVLADQIEFVISHDNALELKPTCNLDQYMQPFWQGKTIHNETVLMFSKNGQPAAGRLMFKPSRIISVKDYGLTTNYAEGTDYILDGRGLICTPSSRITEIKDANLLKGEFSWNEMTGKQIAVTYEPNDTWTGPAQNFVGDSLPNTMKKLRAHTPLRVVAYGDSITHGVGVSRVMNIPPFMPPYPELFVTRLKQIYHDDAIQFFNSAQSGATSDWGARMAGRMVVSLNPDLVTIAFGQNDFWSIPADTFANNISKIIQTVRTANPRAEFLLVSTFRFDPAYTTNTAYWQSVGEYESKLKAMTGPGVQFVDMTAISEAIYAAKKPKDCLNDPLHPNDYLARWYAQSLVAALDPVSGRPPIEPAPKYGGSKKGVGQDGRNIPEAVEALGCSWYYNWKPRPFSEDLDVHAEFVPMIWDAVDLDASLADAKASGATNLLGFNEPDNQEQANMTVAEAVAQWPKLMATGMRLGSPATKTEAKWLDDFMAEAKQKNLRVDFLCLHWYGDITRPNAVASLQKYLQGYWERYHLPIWLTEFSGADFDYHKRKTTVQDNAAFAADTGAMLEELPFVERYAWFGSEWTPQAKEYSKVGLYDPGTRTLTPVGIAYRGVMKH